MFIFRHEIFFTLRQAVNRKLGQFAGKEIDPGHSIRKRITNIKSSKTRPADVGPALGAI